MIVQQIRRCVGAHVFARMFWLISGCGALTLCAAQSNAAIITFTHSGSTSGTLGGQAFAARPFQVIATGTTESRVAVTSNIFVIAHTSATISLEGLGTFAFSIPTQTFVNNLGRSVGFTATTSGLDLIEGPRQNAALATWDMTTTLAPISGRGFILQWADEPVATSGGVLVLNENFSATLGFEAVVIPAPASALVLAASPLVLTRRRRACID